MHLMSLATLALTCEVRPALLRIQLVAVLAIVTMTLVPTSAFATCGEKGGPGYRGPNGKCVGWAALARTCGNPPTLRCTAELAQPEAPDAAKKGSQIQGIMDAAHRRVKDTK